MIAVKATIVVALAYVAALALRHRSAALRHCVLGLGLIAAGLLPAIETIAPAWGSSFLRSSTLIAVSGGDREWAAAAWLAGSAAGIAMLAVGLARIAWMRASANADVSDTWQRIADEVTAEYGIRRPITLLETRRAAIPVTWGLVRPKILLPFVAREWDEHRLRAVLRHEIAHVSRGDWAVHLLAALVTRLHWFNPILWLANRRLRIESERACDDAVLNLGADGTEYAGHLVAIARALNSRRAVTSFAAAAARAEDLECRITAALDNGVARPPLSSVAVLLVAIVTAAVAVPVAGLGLSSSPTSSTSVLDVQRDIMMRFGGEERRFSIVSNDVSFWRNRIEGRVELQARLNVDGSVSGVRFVEPVHPDLANAAQVLVRQWRREPATIRGVPVAVPIRMTVDFRK